MRDTLIAVQKAAFEETAGLSLGRQGDRAGAGGCSKERLMKTWANILSTFVP